MNKWILQTASSDGYLRNTVFTEEPTAVFEAAFTNTRMHMEDR